MYQSLTKNELHVLNTIRRVPNSDRTRLAEASGFSIPTISTVVKKLLNDRYVVSNDDYLEVAAEIASHIGISVGTSKIRVVLLDAKFECINPNTFFTYLLDANDERIFESNMPHINEHGLVLKTPDTLGELQRYINTIIQRLIVGSGDAIRSVGIAFPGMVNINSKMIIKCHNRTYLENVPLTNIINPEVWRILSEKKVTISINHNSRCAAIAEKEKSPDCLTKEFNSACLYLGTGIGLGCIYDNRIYNGVNGTAGQIGHFKLSAPLLHPEKSVKDYGKCSCGQYGCVEHMLRKEVFNWDLKAFMDFDGELKDDQLDGVSRYIAYIISNLLNEQSFDTIILTGKLSKSYNKMWSGITELYKEWCYSGLETQCTLRTSMFGSYAPAVGAAIFSYFENTGCALDWNK